MKSTVEEAYFQFPLRMISAATSKDIIQNASSYALWNFGAAMTKPDVDFNYRAYVKLHPDFKHTKRDLIHQMLMASAFKLSISLGSIMGEVDYTYRYQVEKSKGGFQVRLRHDLAWDAHNHEWPLMKLRTLCAVYAAIGSKGATYLHHKQLSAMVSGYNSQRDAGDRTTVSVSTVRYWLDHLHQRQLFKVCIHKGKRWYGIAFKDDLALARWVKKRTAAPVKRDVIDTASL